MRSGIFLLLGTNLGDRLNNLTTARAYLIREVGPIVASSGVYETAAWGKTDQASFYNQAIRIDTDADPQHLLTNILSIEHKMGRVRQEKWGPRVIDIDILLYHDLILSDVNLSVPHIGLPHRRFVLEPLNEIAPNLVHPGLLKTVHELLHDCKDPSQVERL